MNLNTISNNTTRRLDNTYYSVLEKLSTLQSSISSLKELSNIARDLNADFKTESEEVIREISDHLESFHDFAEQEQRIYALQERVHKGRDKVKVLGDRVDVVRERVEGWQRAELVWQDKTRKRLRILWIMMSVVAAVVFGLVVFRYTPARSHGPSVMRGFNASELLEKIPDFEDLKNETLSLRRSAEGSLKKLKNNKEKEVLEEDPRLRVFDEL